MEGKSGLDYELKTESLRFGVQAKLVKTSIQIESIFKDKENRAQLQSLVSYCDDDQKNLVSAYIVYLFVPTEGLKVFLVDPDDEFITDRDYYEILKHKTKGDPSRMGGKALKARTEFAQEKIELQQKIDTQKFADICVKIYPKK